jgi:predicted ATPase/DNA-binding SARP family transcriptional activator
MQVAVGSPGLSSPTSCRVQLLGGLRVTLPGSDVTPAFPRKIGALLAYLACFPHRSHSRDALIELLWPEVDLESGRASLRNALPLLRRQLEPPGVTPGSLLIVDRRTVRLDPQQITTDVEEFERDLQAAARGTSPSEQAVLLDRAILRYGGELLPGYYEPWVLTERERLAAAYVAALRRLAAARVQQGDFEGAIDAARRAVQADPLEEEAHYDLIQHYAAAGQGAAARRHYKELERLLKAELEIAPSRSLQELLEAGERMRQISPAAPAGSPSPRRAPPSPRLSVPPLPVPLTPFFGREEEIAQVCSLLASSRLVTLTGLGGAGKTRLALEVARHVQEEESEWAGVAFVPLADLSDPRLILQTLRGALNLPPAGATNPLEQIATCLAGQRFLLVLDNFEQLVVEGAGTVERLLTRAPDLTCLVTSRRPLGLSEEAVYLVPPLPTPAAAVLPERLLEFAGVRLFLNRAQAARPDFQVTEANAEAVSRLCQALEGIPLALELAAARAPVLTPAQMLAHLTDRFSFLVARHRDVAERHRTLRAALECSYQSLPDSQQRLLARLSVFRGGWSVEAAVVVGAGEPLILLDQLMDLRAASLLTTEEAGEEMRFRMLDTVREYAAERLMEGGEATTVCERHRDWYLGLAEQARRELDGSAQAAWLNRLDTEHDNLRAALACCFAEESAVEKGLRLTRALAQFWQLRGYLGEGRAYLAAALGREGAVPPTRERALALNAAAVLAWMQGDYEAATALFEESLAIERRMQDRLEIAWSLHQLGHVASDQGDFERARTLYDESLAIFRELDDPSGISTSLSDQANVALKRGDQEAARSLYEESLAIAQASGNRVSIAVALNNLGKIARDQGDTGAARAMHRKSLTIRLELGDRGGYPWSLEAFARLAAPVDPERAARLWGAAESLRESLGLPLPPNEHPEYDRALAAVREALGEGTFARVWAAGRAMPVEEAITCALETDNNGR